MGGLMDTFRAELISLLLENLGTIQVYPFQRQQTSSLPAIVMNITSRQPHYADDGEVGLTINIVVFDCWAETATDAIETAASLFGCLSAYTSDNDSSSPTRTSIDFVEMTDERDLSETGSNQAEYLFRITQTYRIVERRSN